jgi:tRNA pseudouridine55 synthase
MNGLVLIDKPPGCTSHDVVNQWRKLANTKRAGHLGTLDPMATGLLALVSGSATRLAPFFSHDEKTYVAEITLGLVSDTYDAQGEISATGVAPPADEGAIGRALDAFRGRIWQTPPAVSAKKVNGVPAYKLARRHTPVELPAVEVEIKQLGIECISPPVVRIKVTCSTGTYIRSLAHDLGQCLGCGALLSNLRRIAIGGFSIEHAHTLEALRGLAAAGRLSDAVIPAAQLLPQFPAEHFDSVAEARIRQGRDFRTSPFVVRPGAPFVKALSRSGELIAIGELRVPNLYHPATVF